MTNRHQQGGPTHHHHYIRAIRGAVVHFEPGAKVAFISLCSTRTRLDAPPCTKKWTVRRRIKLTKSGFLWAITEGVQAMRPLPFYERVSLDIVKKEIILPDSKKAYDELLEALNMLRPYLIHSVRGDCNICFTEADDPIVLDCGHMYCRECLVNLCEVKDATREFSLTCKGNEDRCHMPISIAMMQELLPPPSFERVLQTSLETYIRRRPQEYRCCPAPECGYIYRLSPGSPDTHHDCRNCKGRICLEYDEEEEGEAEDDDDEDEDDNMGPPNHQQPVLANAMQVAHGN
ncbi:hypothetical protein CERZMDRAFT_119130 [Cercospora zeae-maydis SCOH1-5]|uniref:RING-type domain-containing protein n=1 Tax=Cercospora zeae-maydis SCOH1-5 TaxID=717836 RepID=A0A6A6F3N5_9PEZI|nr:hypothetical protein CERZMDRAFT_119130 [Cercospora zeae-maydis SCOH1-5]